MVEPPPSNLAPATVTRVPSWPVLGVSEATTPGCR
jgi:hypothetical protein